MRSLCLKCTVVSGFLIDDLLYFLRSSSLINATTSIFFGGVTLSLSAVDRGAWGGVSPAPENFCIFFYFKMVSFCSVDNLNIHHVEQPQTENVLLNK